MLVYLVYCTRDEARDVSLAVEDLRESCAKGGRSLDSWEADLAYTVTVTKAKDALCLVKGHTLLDATHGPVESWG